jgi:hypothetical protein
LLERLRFQAVDEPTALGSHGAAKVPAKIGEHLNPGHDFLRIGSARINVNLKQYIAGRTKPDQHPNLYAHYHLGPLTLNLDGPTRVTLCDQQIMGDLKEPSNPLSVLYVSDAKRSALRKIIHEAIGLYFAIDNTVGGHLNVRFGATPPPNERTHEDATIEYMRNARDITMVSDGVKAFTGMLLQVYAGDPEVIIVDEPEAFLHPALAHRLGSELARAAITQQKLIFAATHSAQFVMGAIQSGAKVNIVRLTYAGGVGTARLLPSSELITLMTDPLLRSVNIVAGLFYDAVVVSEADADRAFYEEINYRLVAARDARAILHALFLNADNKQTVPRIIAPLRKLGIPTAAIVDIDIVKDGGNEWTKQLDAVSIPPAQFGALQIQRQGVFNALTAAAPPGTVKPQDYFKINGGIDLLSHPDKEAAGNLFDEIGRYGFFVVRKGEVESWLPVLAMPRKTGGWRSKIFAAMGSDPNDAGYLKAGPGDVWDFVGKLAAWLGNPARRGIPQ